MLPSLIISYRSTHTELHANTEACYDDTNKDKHNVHQLTSEHKNDESVHHEQKPLPRI